MFKKIHLVLTLTLVFVFLSSVGFSQKKMNWRKHIQLADELYLKSYYADAADHYLHAFRKKPKKKELVFKAAECFYIIKDYRKAAENYKHVKDEFKKFPLAGMRYARCLKQDEKYDEASREFVYFLNNYNRSDKGVVSELVQNEIRGCELGIKQAEMGPNPNVQVVHLGSHINSPETEFGPLPITDNLLYFSSTVSTKGKIYYTTRSDNGKWKKPQLPKSLPKISDHYGNGTLSPDGKRFYFTICKSEETWGELTTQCEINYIKKVGDSWSNPQRLRDYINVEKTTTTQPFVIHQDGKEVIYFASNREGGFGGMDIWYTERSISSDDIDFTFPINLGATINTMGDEKTPFYDEKMSKLYFSSNGMITLGGHDILSAEGNKTTWSAPVNIGSPYNSPADDFSFTMNKSRTGGFLVSNRLFGMEKITTTHEDIFEFKVTDEPVVINASTEENEEETVQEEVVTQEEAVVQEEIAVQEEKVAVQEEKVVQEEVVSPPVVETPRVTEPVISTPTPAAKKEYGVSGTIYDDSKELVEDFVGTLYELTPNNRKRFLNNKVFENGTYSFELEGGKDYYLEIRRDGYVDGSALFTTKNKEKIAKDVYLIREIDPTVLNPVASNETEAPRVNTSPQETVQNNVRSNRDEVVENKNEFKTVPVAPMPGETRSTQPVEETRTYSNESTNAPVQETTTTKTEYVDEYYIARGIGKHDNVEFRAKSPRHGGTYYKVQIIAAPNFDPYQRRFTNVEHHGRFDTEYILAKNVNRVLIADFFSFDEAKRVLRSVQRNGFKRAFIVKYQDGERVGMMYR